MQKMFEKKEEEDEQPEPAQRFGIEVKFECSCSERVQALTTGSTFMELLRLIYNESTVKRFRNVSKRWEESGD